VTEHDTGDRDEGFFAAIAEQGGDLTQPFTVEHYLEEFPDGSSADAAADDVRSLGYDAFSTALDDDMGWLVEATRVHMLNADDVGGARRELTEVADRHGAVYRGWALPEE
jgi:hypothetical protein